MRVKSKIDVGEVGADKGPVLTVSEFAELIRKPLKTVRHWVQMGYLDGCCRRRGKSILVVRELALDRIFNGPDWK